MQKKVPLYSGWPILNNVIPFLKDLLYYPQKIQKKCGDIFQLPLSLFSPIFVFSPSGIRHVLEKNHKNYKKGSTYDALKISLGKGLLTNEGESWKASRKAIQPYFFDDVITRFVDIMMRHSDVLVKEWSKKTEPFAINRPMKTLTLSIASEAFFGVHLKDISIDIPKIVDELNRLTITETRFPRNFIPYVIPTFNHLRMRYLMSQLNTQIDSLSKSSDLDNYNLLALLLNTPSFSKQQIRDEIITFLVAGYETTANAMFFTIMLLAKHTKIQGDIRDEVLAQPLDPSSYKEWKHTYPLLYASIQESMRLYPPAWLIGREALEDDTIDGCHIPKGSDILLDVFLIHRHPDYWEDPETFDPTRFLTPLKEKMSYLPFGGGPRVCVGQHFAMLEMVTALHHILSTFSLETDCVDIKLDPLVTLTPKSDGFISLKMKD